MKMNRKKKLKWCCGEVILFLQILKAAAGNDGGQGYVESAI